MVPMVVSMVVGVATYASKKQYISDDELCSDQSCLMHELLQKEESSLLSRRQHAPNKGCVLNSDVCLITRFYKYKKGQN